MNVVTQQVDKHGVSRLVAIRARQVRAGPAVGSIAGREHVIVHKNWRAQILLAPEGAAAPGRDKKVILQRNLVGNLADENLARVSSTAARLIISDRVIHHGHGPGTAGEINPRTCVPQHQILYQVQTVAERVCGEARAGISCDRILLNDVGAVRIIQSHTHCIACDEVARDLDTAVAVHGDAALPVPDDQVALDNWRTALHVQAICIALRCP